MSEPWKSQTWKKAWIVSYLKSRNSFCDCNFYHHNMVNIITITFSVIIAIIAIMVGVIVFNISIILLHCVL